MARRGAVAMDVLKAPLSSQRKQNLKAKLSTRRSTWM
jgi:hypothetical protein